ncbi:MAG: hypothetical protein AAFY91_06675 [Bacteroidota bacterium]
MPNHYPYLAFSTNWNNKLLCNCWTTLRLWNPEKYVLKTSYAVHLKDEYVGEAQLINARKFKASNINDYIGFLDTGYNAAQTKKIIANMYKRIDDPTVGLYLFKWVKRHPGSPVDFKAMLELYKDSSLLNTVS